MKERLIECCRGFDWGIEQAFLIGPGMVTCSNALF